MVQFSRYVATSALLALLLAAPANGEPIPPRTISVNGHAEVSAAPDRLELAVAVETEDGEAGRAVQENARRSTLVLEALRKLIGKDDRVTTTGYSVQPRYSVANPKPGEASEPKIVGYTASNTVSVESRQIELAGKLIDASIKAGANRISNVRFTLSERAPYLRSAIEQAGRDAQVQAESLAAALKVRLKGVLNASTSGVPIVQPKHYDTYAMSAMRSAEMAPPIQAGDVSVTADVLVTYEISAE